MANPAVLTAFDPIIQSLQEFAPLMAYTLGILVGGYIVGRIVHSLVKRLLEDTHVDSYFMEEGHLELKLSQLFADLGKWLVFFLFLWAASGLWADKLNTVAFQEFLSAAVNWIAGVIGAIAVFLAGYGIAIYTKDRIIGAETIYADLLGKTVFFFVIYIAISTALPLAGIRADLLNNILLILVGSAGLAFAIAAGLGLKDVVEDEARAYVDEMS